MKKIRAIFIILLAFVYSINNAQVTSCTKRVTSLTKNNEDPWPMKANDGKFYVAYYSDSLSLPSIFITRSKNGGQAWDSAWVAIQTSDSCFYPCMAQAKNGTFHLVWFRIGGGLVDVWYSKSTNAINWSAPVNISSMPGIDWFPNLLIDLKGNLRVTFSSDRTGNLDLFNIVSTNGGTTWANATQLTSNTKHDSAPYLFQKSDSSFVLTWERYTGTILNYLSNTTEVYYKTSLDGISWGKEDSVVFDTGTPFVDALPSIYQNPINKEVYFVWTSDRLSPQGNNFEHPLSAILSGTLGNNSSTITLPAQDITEE